MRKYIPIFIILTTMLGCTLSIEDELVPEERKGFEQPETVVSDYGTITYQFTDSVLYVTERVQEHITMINDSTLLYDNSTPREWRPYAGCKLAASVSHLIPNGLNNRVTSVSSTGDGWVVYTQRTTIEDVYKTLSYEIDCDHNVPYVDPEATDEELAAMGMERLADSTIACWTQYDKDRAKALGLDYERKVLTRGSETQDTDKTEEHFNVAFTVSADGITGIKSLIGGFKNYTEALKSACKNVDNMISKKYPGLGNVYIAMNFSWATHTHTHIVRKDETNYEENINEQYNTVTIGAELGFSKSSTPAHDANSIGNIGKGSILSKEMEDILKNDMLSEFNKDNAGKISMPGKKIKFFFFTIGPVPMNLVFSAETSAEISINAAIGVKCTYKSATTQTGYIISDGEETKVDRKIAEGDFTFDNFYLQGKFKAIALGRIAIGLEVAGSVGADVGANVETGIEATMSNTYVFNSSEKSAWEIDGKVRLYCDFYGDVHFFVAPFGLTFLDKQVLVFYKKNIFELSSKFNPTISYVYSYASPPVGEKSFISACYGVKSMGMANIYYMFKNIKPEMRMYFGDYSPNSQDYVVMGHAIKGFKPTDETFYAKAGQDYYFTWEGKIPDETPYVTMVPYLVGEEDVVSESILLTDAKQTAEVAQSNISLLNDYTHQTYGGESFNFSGEVESYVDMNADALGGGVSVDPSTLRMYKLMAGFLVSNGSFIQSWGAKVKIYNSDKKRIGNSRKIRLTPSKTGIYTLIVTYYTNWTPTQTGIDGKTPCMYYRVTPYWKDSQGINHEGEESGWIPIEYDTGGDSSPDPDDVKVGFYIEKDL